MTLTNACCFPGKVSPCSETFKGRFSKVLKHQRKFDGTSPAWVGAPLHPQSLCVFENSFLPNLDRLRKHVLIYLGGKTEGYQNKKERRVQLCHSLMWA